METLERWVKIFYLISIKNKDNKKVSTLAIYVIYYFLENEGLITYR
jgi:hypothetical protein